MSTIWGCRYRVAEVHEVDNQIRKAVRLSGYLRDIIWKNMTTESKTRIYKTCVRPIMTYAAETRAEMSVTKRKMRTEEMKIRRTIKGITLQDRICQENTRGELGVKDVVRWVRERERETLVLKRPHRTNESRPNCKVGQNTKTRNKAASWQALKTLVWKLDIRITGRLMTELTGLCPITRRKKKI